MNQSNIAIALFTVFAFGLPIWAMQNNDYPKTSVHDCSGDCYEDWQTETGGVIEVLAAAQAARAEASPAELGKQAYAGCVACHGAGGEGGVGPQLSGQSADDIVGKLLTYKAGETIGNQSNLMWAQAAMLSEDDIDNIGAFVETL
ncbi:MAG: c-type cytochrome [Pseudomonadota bacterium]